MAVSSSPGIYFVMLINIVFVFDLECTKVVGPQQCFSTKGTRTSNQGRAVSVLYVLTQTSVSGYWMTDCLLHPFLLFELKRI